MSKSFPPAVPEIPVRNIAAAAEYYEKCLGFSRDWGADGGGIAQVSRGKCRLFLTDPEFRRENRHPTQPVVTWLNLGSKKEVDALHDAWRAAGARILSKPESKPWNLHEFLAEDVDGNRLRVFYDFEWELPGKV